MLLGTVRHVNTARPLASVKAAACGMRGVALARRMPKSRAATLGCRPSKGPALVSTPPGGHEGLQTPAFSPPSSSHVCELLTTLPRPRAWLLL